MVTVTLLQDSKRDTDVLNSLLDSVGEGEGGMIWENGIETCKISYVKQIASPGLMHEAGCSGCTGMTKRDRMGREVGGRVRIGNTCTPMADSCECMAKQCNIVE